MKKIGIIDGQGGGIGSAIIQRLKKTYGESIEIIALGTNAIATAQMLKARANRGASGENAICRGANQVDVIIGPLGIVMAHAMMGEITPPMAQAVAASPAVKLLLPLNQENVDIVGASTLPLPRLIEKLIGDSLQPYLEESNHV